MSMAYRPREVADRCQVTAYPRYDEVLDHRRIAAESICLHQAVRS